MFGVKFGNKHSYDDFNVYLKEKDIGFPDVKRETVEIEGRDGCIDLSTVLTNDVKYKNRKLSFTFQAIGSKFDFPNIISKISNYLHGRNYHVVLDDDKTFYYEGNVTINKFKTNKALGEITIDVDAQPYKMEVVATGEPWIWDTFSFVDGIIHTSELTVNGTATINLINRRKVVSPTITCSDAMSATLNGVTVQLKKGENKVFDFRLKEGDNVVTFKGNGKVNIMYRGGSL